MMIQGSRSEFRWSTTVSRRPPFKDPARVVHPSKVSRFPFSLFHFLPLTSNAFIFIQFHTLSRNGALPTPFVSITSALFSMQWRGVSTTSADDPRDSAKIRGLLLFSLLSAVSCRLSAYVSPLECALTSKCRVLPVFNRSWPSVTPLECALTGFGVVSPLECALTKKGGGGAAWPNFEFRFSSFDQSRPPVRLRPHLPRGLLLCFLPLIT